MLQGCFDSWNILTTIRIKWIYIDQILTELDIDAEDFDFLYGDDDAEDEDTDEDSD